MKCLILPVVSGWQEQGGAEAPRVWSSPSARGVWGSLGPPASPGKSQVGGGCSLGMWELTANPRIQVNLSIPLFWLYQPFKVVNYTNLAKLKPQCLSEGRAVRERFSKFTISPWLLHGFGLNPWEPQLQAHKSYTAAVTSAKFLPPLWKLHKRGGRRQG